MAQRGLRDRVRKRARQVGLFLDEPVLDGLVAYFDLLRHWNQRINLTSLGETDEALDRLLIEPLVALRYVPADAATLLDVGSGGGSPALPMKLGRPGLRLWMVEPKTRKAAFLREAVRHLGLEGATVEAARYEELLVRPELHEAMDLASVRAFRVEARTLRSLQAFLKPGGHLLLFRGPSGTEVPGMLTPPLTWQGTFPLVDSLRSRLVVLKKAGPGVEPRPVAGSGTLR